MFFWDGEKNDTTNFTTDKYLKINSCGFQNIMSEHTVIRKKGRHDYHILLVDNGMCEAIHNNKKYTLKKGNIIIYAPDEPQRYTLKINSLSLWLHFTGTAVNEILTSCNIKSGVYFLPPNNMIFEAYSTLIRRFNQPGGEKLANASLIELISYISDAAASPASKNKSDCIDSVLTYINMNYNKHITLDELAKISGYSKSRFSHLFSEITGTTPIKYQNDMRLKTACEMLHSTNLSICEISLLCGFNDQLYFSKLFKKKYNISPKNHKLLKN